jgi:hypothetical protein
MRENIRNLALGAMRGSLLSVGRRLPNRVQYHLNAVFDYLSLGAWMGRRGLTPRHFADREALFAHLGDRCGKEQVLYLEFGVAGGASMRTWARLLRHPKTELHGFDSFEGLPTDWILDRPAGHFDQQGRPPTIDDARVRLHKGWFAETFAGFQWPEGWDRLVANFDADLYSSTSEALRFIEDHIRPGTILYFDEFNHHEHERRALEESLARTGARIIAVGETRAMSKVAFEVVSDVMLS